MRKQAQERFDEQRDVRTYSVGVGGAGDDDGRRRRKRKRRGSESYIHREPRSFYNRLLPSASLISDGGLSGTVLIDETRSRSMIFCVFYIGSLMAMSIDSW